MDSDEIAVAPATSPSPPTVPEMILPSVEHSNNTSAMNKGATRLPPPLQPNKKNQASAALTFKPPSNHDKEVRSDLAQFGFSASEVKGLISKKEDVWDPATPGHLLDEGKSIPGTRAKLERKKVRLSAGEKYEPLFVSNSSKWALFDPNRGFPTHLRDPPAFFEDLATFKPGNTRILEYNIKTGSVRLKSTPSSLEGASVEYLKTGPRIVEMAVKPRRGRPRKLPLPVNKNAHRVIKKALPVERPKKTVPRWDDTEESQTSGSDSELTEFEVEDWEEIEVKSVKAEDG